MSVPWWGWLLIAVGYLTGALWAFVGLRHYSRFEWPLSWRAGDRSTGANIAFALGMWWHPAVLVDVIKGHYRARKERHDRHRQAKEGHRDRASGDANTGTGAPGNSASWYAKGGTIGASPGVSYGIGQFMPSTFGSIMFARPESPAVGPLPTEQRDIPIVAYKAAHLQVSPDGRTVQLVSTNASHIHHREERAVCQGGQAYQHYLNTGEPSPDHTPAPDCTCGFYALFTSDEVKPQHGIVRMEVELFGRVIECESGYRAERQRILSVSIDSACHGFLCDTRAEFVCFPSELQPQQQDLTGTWTLMPQQHKYKPPFPSCAEHVTVPKDRAVRLDRIAARLGGMEVCWA